MAAPRRAPYGSAAIPTSRNDGNSIDRPTAAYHCVDRSPRAETQRQPERGANHEERAHRRQLGAEQSRSDGEPCDPHAQSRDPPDRSDPTHEGEPRGPFRPLRGLHEEDRPGGAARGAQETREEIREGELGHGPAEGHRKEGEPAPEETDQDEDLAARGAIGERSP